MFSTDDTIVAIATPLGRSGIGIVRLSGPKAAEIACEIIGRSRPLRPRRATLARMAGAAVADQVVVTWFDAPHSYTGEHVVEIGAHGSPVILQAVLQSGMDAGARLAEPGEFTLRAFLNGKLDLVQAEAVADLIEAVTPAQARVAFDQLEGTLTTAIGLIEERLFDVIARLEASLDFPEEGYHFVAPDAARAEIDEARRAIAALLAQAALGRLIRDGAQVAIVGTPNVGKSSLFNALLNANRAIVTPIPGTTRDLLTERVDLGGYSVALIDTAGMRETRDEIEQEGVARAERAAAVADLTLVVLDRSRPLEDEDRRLLARVAARRHLVVLNKIDRAGAWSPGSFESSVALSAMTGEGIDTLITRIGGALGGGQELRDGPLVTNLRHAALLEHAATALDAALAALGGNGQGVPEEFVLADLQRAAAALQEITGRRTTDDLLRHIFERFCVGK